MQLKGWVRNTDDKVEIVVEGLSAVMKDFEEALWKGPIGIRVESVVLTVENYKGEFSDFVVKK